jgi:hypothetical protein
VLSQHLGGELPKQIVTQTTQTAPESVTKSVISKLPSQTIQIASETISEVVVSEIQPTTKDSEPPFNTSNKTVSDTSCVLEDKTIIVIPLQFAKPKPTQIAYDVLMIEALEGETQQEHTTQLILASDDNIMAMEVSEPVISEITSSSTQLTSTIHPPPTLTSNLVLQEVCSITFDSLLELLKARH